MAHALETRANSPANELRDALDSVERLIVSPNRETIEPLLTSLDKISALFSDLSTLGVDLRSEEVRWEGIRSRLHSQPGPIVAAANAAGGFAALRAKNVTSDGEWWRLDHLVNERRRQTLTRSTVTLSIILAAAMILYSAINYFFPPNPDAIFVLETEQHIDEALRSGALVEAQQTALAAANELPTEPELWLWVTVLSEQLGDQATAERALMNARELVLDRPLALLIDLGNKRLQIGNLDGAEEAGNEALAIDVEHAQAYFLLAGVEEMRGNSRAAIDYFEKTFELAEDDDPQLAVIAKVRMGTLMQSLDPFSEEESPEQSTPVDE